MPPSTNTKATNPLPTVWFAALTLSFCVAYYPVWKALVLTWQSSEENSHGFLVVPIVCYLIWQKRATLRKLEVEPSNWGIVLILFSLGLYVLSHFANILTVAPFSIIPLAFGTSIFLFGFSITKELLFPLCFLLFMLPIPTQVYSALTLPLQLFVSKASVNLASLLGIPLYREGNVIHLPEHTLQVVQACSGLRSMTSLLALSALIGYLSLKSNLLRSVLLFSGIPAAIFVNIVRVSLMIIAFYYLNFDLTSGTIHTVFGLAIFSLAFIFILAVRGALSRWDLESTDE